jgi:hypothetical protein
MSDTHQPQPRHRGDASGRPSSIENILGTLEIDLKG